MKNPEAYALQHFLDLALAAYINKDKLSDDSPIISNLRKAHTLVFQHNLGTTRLTDKDKREKLKVIKSLEHIK